MLKVTFAVLNLCNTHNSGNIVLTTVCLHINWKVHAACDLNFIVCVHSSHVYTGKVVVFHKLC